MHRFVAICLVLGAALSAAPAADARHRKAVEKNVKLSGYCVDYTSDSNSIELPPGSSLREVRIVSPLPGAPLAGTFTTLGREYSWDPTLVSTGTFSGPDIATVTRIRHVGLGEISLRATRNPAHCENAKRQGAEDGKWAVTATIMVKYIAGPHRGYERYCRRRVENLKVTWSRNMSCARAARVLRRSSGCCPKRFTASAGFRCRATDGGKYWADFRCRRGKRWFEFSYAE